MKRKVAIFDIDGTVFRSSLLIELVEVLIDEGIFKSEARNLFVREKRKWQDRQGDYESYIMAVVRAFEKHIVGVKYGDFMDASKIVVSRERDSVYRYTRDLLEDLNRKGYYMLAISQSPKALLDIFCKRLGFDKVYGRIYEIGSTDKFTGKITDIHLIGNKANIVKRVIEKEGLDLKGSIGVGDTEGDISFLELVEEPICFNPNSILLRHARINDWKVVVERKDVVYEL
ncbi:MAG: HAD-IB family hydrolase [Parcubacteria group bacterium CG11_big_fil_rev_8_21_14_0_20_39_22]|nr:MAG: HAD-IB family hydrolase [Parcubacteria group bacterium CG11_big_fil_rev_8_21_14_0_20_39_22]